MNFQFETPATWHWSLQNLVVIQNDSFLSLPNATQTTFCDEAKFIRCDFISEWAVNGCMLGGLCTGNNGKDS